MFTFSLTNKNYIIAFCFSALLMSFITGTRAETGSTKVSDKKITRQQAEPVSDYDSSTVLVQFKSGVSDSDRGRIIADFGGVVQRTFTLVPGLAEVRVGTNVGHALSVLKSSIKVIAAEPNYRLTVSDIPNDPHFSKQWSLESATAVHINATGAWALRKGNHTLKLAVLDTGIDRTHPEFADNIWSNPLEVAGDGIDNDANGYIDDTSGWDFTYSAPGTLRSNGDNDPTDGHGHGTHVSGIIAAQGNNATGVAGICWDAAIVPLKVVGDDGSGLTSWMIAAVEYCVRNKISVANASIGGANFSGFCKAAIDAAGTQGNLLYVASAGNNGTDNDSTPFYPASYDCPNIISVASTTSSGAVSSFSNRGLTSVDIAAPGSSITSTYPVSKSASGYITLSGTSMAAPMVTAVAGLLHENRPEWGYAEIKQTLLASVTRLNSLSGRVASGGLVNAHQAMLLSNQVELIGLRLSRTVLRGGDTVTAEVTLDRVAPAGGVDVNLSSNLPATCFPECVRIPGGHSAVTVSGVVKAVGTTANGEVSATVQGRTLSVPITVKPPVLSAVQIGLPVIAPGGTTQGLVSIEYAAGDGGLDIALTSDDPSVVVPPSVHIDAGKTEAGFDVRVVSGCLPGRYQIKASTDADCVCVDITVLAAVLQKVGFTPNVVVSGQSMSLRVGISAPAPVGGLVATLRATSTVLQIPAEVVIPAGEKHVDVHFVAPAVTSNTSISVTAGFYGTASDASVLVVPTMLSAVVPTFTDVAAGSVTAVEIRLAAPAGPGGHDVQLSEDSGKLSFPSKVHIVAGQSSTVVLVRAANVSMQSSVVLLASDGIVELSVPMTVSPVTIALLSLSKTSVAGGTGAVGTIKLAATAPGSGVNVSISSGNSAVSVPTNLSIPAGATQATFAISTSPVLTRLITDIMVSTSTSSVSKRITVNPASVLSVKLQRSSMTGGASQQAVVMLSGPAPDGGLVVTLSTSNGAVRVPNTLTIPAGAVNGVIDVHSVPVASRVSGQVIAQLGALKKTATISVVPPVISSVVASSRTVISGGSVGLTINLTGAAPAGGTLVTLKSSNIALSVPASVIVPAGQTSVTVSGSANQVAKSVTVTVSGITGVTSRSGTVRVTPS